MKLYSRSQLVIGIVAVALVIAASSLGAGYYLALHRSGAAVADRIQALDNPADANQSLVTEPQGTSEAPAATPVDLSPQAKYSQGELENISVYEKYNESVVNITTEVMGVNWFLDPVPQSGGSGSGSIIDASGYVLTNFHVVENAYKLFVNMADGTQYEAKLIGSDQRNDLAVIKFQPSAKTRLVPISFGTSKNLKVGQKVLAIGNPFGLERTLTEGIVSGLGRPIQKDETTILKDMIQTDASINPGNSGGPLFNSRGEMIGINTMIYSTSGGSVGVGFAIPVDTAVRIVPELIRNGKVLRGWMDLQVIQLFPALVSYLKSEGQGAPVDKGLLINTVTSGGNADKAGLRGGKTAVRYGRSTFFVGGDILVSVDGIEVASEADLYSALDDNRPGDKVAVEYYRGSSRIKATVVLSERAE